MDCGVWSLTRWVVCRLPECVCPLYQFVSRLGIIFCVCRVLIMIFVLIEHHGVPVSAWWTCYPRTRGPAAEVPAEPEPHHGDKEWWVQGVAPRHFSSRRKVPGADAPRRASFGETKSSMQHGCAPLSRETYGDAESGSTSVRGIPGRDLR